MAVARPAPKRVAAKPDVAKLQAALDKLVGDREGPPGIAVVLTHGKQRNFLRASVANTESGTPPRIGDHIRIASVAKGFSSYLAVRIAERHDGFSLAQTLGESIPGTLPKAEAVTAAELLQHTSGLAEYIQSKPFVAMVEKDPTAYLAPQQIIGFVKSDPLEFAPGSKYHYSDSDNKAVGLMEEAATGQTYGGLLKSIAFGPLGMSSSSLPKTVRMPQPAITATKSKPPSHPRTSPKSSTLPAPGPRAGSSRPPPTSPASCPPMCRPCWPPTASCRGLSAPAPPRPPVRGRIRPGSGSSAPDQVRHGLRPYRLLPRLPALHRRQRRRDPRRRLRGQLPDRSREGQ